jgi:hypothetical protein
MPRAERGGDVAQDAGTTRLGVPDRAPVVGVGMLARAAGGVDDQQPRTRRGVG